jgi:hypothetical protein
MERRTIFHPHIAQLMNAQERGRTFRIDETTLGIFDGDLARRVLALRPKHDFELTVFKSIAGLRVAPEMSSRVMKAVTQDIRRTISQPFNRDTSHRKKSDFVGRWPKVGYRYLWSMLYAADPWQLRMLRRNPFGLSSHVMRLIGSVGLPLLRSGADDSISALSAVVCAASSNTERRHAIALYRRVSSALVASVTALLTNALWLAFPLRPEVPIKNVLLETLRLMPPAWTLHRKATAQYSTLDSAIRETDDLLVYPLLAHRNRDFWVAPDTFLAERWDGIEHPDRLVNYFPFGHANDRCWAKQLVLSLAEYALQDISQRGLVPDPRQLEATVPVSPFLTISAIKIINQSLASEDRYVEH